MTDLERTFQVWRALSRSDRSKVLTLLTGVYTRGHGAPRHAGGTIAEAHAVVTAHGADS